MANVKTIKDAVNRECPAVKLDDSLEAALETMANENVSALLVKTGNDLVGIITISDIMHSLAREDDPQAVRVSDFMTKCEIISAETVKIPCIQLDEDEEILSAIKVMNEAGVNHVLVSGSGGDPVGMVSSLEIIRLLMS